MQKCYFITDERFVDEKSTEGGVKFCTLEFLHLFQEAYNVELIKVSFRKDVSFKITAKLGIDVYNLYSDTDFLKSLENLTVTEPVIFAFNMTQTMSLTKIVKEKYGDFAKVIMLSHGNESGDFVHTFTRFNKSQSFIKRLTSSYKLGRLLKKEASFKKDYIDLVLTVSDIEQSIDKWLNAKQSMTVPRVISKVPIQHSPIKGRIGFIGDMSHYPNFHAIDMLAKELAAKKIAVDLVLIGNGGKILAEKYPFIQSLGFLEEKELHKEVGSWALFLNLAFYYSRGVSTKLGKALGLGLPILSTSIGNRGYEWKKGNMLIGDTPIAIAELIRANAFDEAKINYALYQTELIANSSPTYADILERLIPIIKSL